MTRRLAALALTLCAAPVLAAPAADPLAGAVAAAQALAARPATAELRCRAADPAAKLAPFAVVEGTLDLATRELTTARAGKSPRLDGAKGAALIDARCGTPAAPIASSDNYEVTPPHDWGQDVLQLPKGPLAAGVSAKFAANLHLCSYDGDWSDSDDVALACELTVR